MKTAFLWSLAGALAGFLASVAAIGGWCPDGCPAIEPHVAEAYRDCDRIIRGVAP